MKNVVAGTAGHIDHGKTALVRALTGVDTDRLEEEKRRGISIDIGFAHLDLTPELRVAFVDVPGHEKFIRNMLAGIGGIDLLVLVVAADSSVQQQTREHFDICRLLGIRRGVVALTKVDLADADMAELVRLEISDLVAGSFLEAAPVVPVSAATGQGIADLKAVLTRLANEAPAKDARGYFRLPVDRSFPMRGFGTVVTGTLLSGSVAAEDEVELHPGAQRLRVRGIQVHGAPAQRAVAGQRTAINLSGIDYGEIARGMTLTHPGLFRPTRMFDCRLRLLETAKPLKHRAPVHFHAGTAEVEGEVRRIGGTQPLEPGTEAYARIVLREPVLLTPGDRFIIRMFSPVVTIGGGTVLDVHPARRPSLDRVRALAAGDWQVFVREAPYGLSREELIARTARTDLTEPWYLAPERGAALIERWREQLAAHHKAQPLAAGMPKEQLRGETPAHVFESLVAREPAIAVTGDVVHLATHRVALKQDEEAASEKIEQAFARAGLRVPAVNEVLAQSGVEAGRARSLLQLLLRSGRLVRVAEDFVFHASALEQLREVVRARRGSRFGVAEFKEWTGVSRKYAIPLLERLDRERVTRRDGDSRVVL